MKRIFASLLIFAFASADAALISRLGGQAYYDNNLDITWLANQNLSGINSWDNQVAWAAGLDISGVTGWRLASMDVNSDNIIVQCASATELACRDNELGYMYHKNGIGSGSTSPFPDFTYYNFWSETEYAEPYSNFANYFNFYYLGSNSGFDKSYGLYAWAVHDGDVSAVPVPAAVWLFGSALAGLGWFRRIQNV